MTLPSRPSRRERAARTFERIKTEPGLARNTIVVVALIAIAGVVGGIVLANQRFITPWADRMEFYANFEASPGVSPGNGQEVRIAGVNVGDIVGADIDEDGQARLKLSLERGHRVYENATLVLRPKSPLNEMYVEISPGGAPAKEIAPDYVFPRTSTQRPIQVDEVLDHLDDNAQQALTALLAESDVALTNAQAKLPGGLDSVRTTTNDLRPVAEELAKRKEKIASLVTSLGQISNAVGGDDKRLATLAASLQTTLHSFAKNAPQVDETLKVLPGLVHNLHRSTDEVKDLADELDPTLRDLEDASEAFPEAMRKLRKTSDKLDDVVDEAKPFLRALKPVISDLRPFADDLQEALPELRKAVKGLDPVTDALVPYLPDVAAFTVQTRSVVSLQDANSGILRGQAQISSHFVPPIFGANNGIKPIPAKPIDGGTTALQKAIPVGPEGQNPPNQDGSKTPRKEPNEVPTPDNSRKLLPGGLLGGGN